MISLFDQNYDVSCKIGEHLLYRKMYNDVIQELKKKIDLLVHLEYVKSFSFFKKMHIDDRLKYLVNGKLYDLVRKMFHSKKKTHFVHDWPTKPPHFVNQETLSTGVKRVSFVNRSSNRILRVKRGKRDMFMPKEECLNGWRYKAYPPDKDLYAISSLKDINKFPEFV